MNAIFAAQHAGIAIDALVAGGGPESSFLQQGAHLTGGVYLRVPQPGGGLLGHLLTAFAAGAFCLVFLFGGGCCDGRRCV
jgi:hypothetical protein